MSIKWTHELTIDTFDQFAEDLAGFAYNKALSATTDHNKAVDLAARALSKTFFTRAKYIADEREHNPESVVLTVMATLVKRKQRQRLTNELCNIENPPSESIQSLVATRAIRQTQIAMPRYAPQYSGLKTSIVLLLVIAFICAAIYVIWNDPFHWITPDDSDASQQISAETVVPVPQADNLVDVQLETVDCGSGSGSVAVKVLVDGPDSDRLREVYYYRDSDNATRTAYQCGDEYYVFFANAADTYTVNVKGLGGLDVERALKIRSVSGKAPILTATSVEKTAGVVGTAVINCELPSGADSIKSCSGGVCTWEDNTITLTLAAEGDTILTVTDSLGEGSSIGFTADGKIIPSLELDVSELVIAHDRATTIDTSKLLPASRKISSVRVLEAEDNASASDYPSISLDAYVTGSDLVITPADNFVGIDSVTIEVVDENDMSAVFSIPVAVINTSPTLDESKLTAEVAHTPSNTGHLFSSITALDAEKDNIRFELTEANYCDVMLSPNGNFLLMLESDYSGRSAYFSFTISDGMLTSGPFTYTVTLNNSLITKTRFSQEFISYSGEDGWYTLNLPSVDNDGDKLDWKVVSTLSDESRTPKGSYISYLDGYSTVRLRVDPELKSRTTETLKLTCSDGWSESGEITFSCVLIPNEAPRAALGNSYTMPEGEKTALIDVKVKNDCIFDVCKVTAVKSCTGGTVADSIGWDEMKYSFTFDDAATSATVVLTVTEIASGRTVDVTCKVTR